MQASVLHQKKDIRLETRDTPKTGAGEVLVRFGYGGICGSDLHYYFHGANGNFAVKHPFVLGHELSGTVVEVGEGVTRVAANDRIAINPGLACGQCDYCRKGQEQLCRKMVFFGSASTMPHTDGGYQEYLVIKERQAVKLPSNFNLRAAAMAEPLAVCLHAVNRAGSLTGKRVLITGAGTIGSLLLLAARAMGAIHITITDVMDERLNIASQIGADQTINVTTPSPEQEALGQGDLAFDVVLEASGNIRALHNAIDNITKGGTIVQVGMMSANDTDISLIKIATHELNYLGTFRFGMEFEQAVDYLVSGRIDVSPLITHTYSFEDAAQAFRVANDGSQSVKVQLYFEEQD